MPLGHERIVIVAHEIELVHIVLLAGMHRYFSGRQAKDEPAIPDIDVGELEHLTQKARFASAFVL